MKYRALVPLYWSQRKGGPPLTCRVGEIRDDLRRESIPWMLKKKWIEKVEEGPDGEVR